MCSGCGRPASVCLCQRVVRVPTRTRVVVLQHPRESRVPIGTARLAELCLPGLVRHVGVDFAAIPEVRALLEDPGASPILLFPGLPARDLELDPPPASSTLVVIDGTWWQAQKVLKKNPILARLPRYSFQPRAPSRYRIRREPAPHCVSTIEAIVQALRLLEPDTPGLEAILGPFEAMVDFQVGFARKSPARRHLTRPRRPDRPSWGRELIGRSLVVGHAETNAWPRGTPLGDGSEVVHLVAERLESGERFQAFIQPRRPLSPSFFHHTGIELERVLSGEPWAGFVQRWGAFLRPGDALACWGPFWAGSLLREGAPVPELVDLRLLARRALRERTGDVERCAEKLGAPPPEPWAKGRTGRRATAAALVTQALFRSAREALAATPALPRDR